MARAAADGELDTEVLRGLDPEEAARRVQQLRGVGPFAAALVVVRTLGPPDVTTDQEHHAAALPAISTGSGAR